MRREGVIYSSWACQAGSQRWLWFPLVNPRNEYGSAHPWGQEAHHLNPQFILLAVHGVWCLCTLPPGCKHLLDHCVNRHYFSQSPLPYILMCLPLPCIFLAWCARQWSASCLQVFVCGGQTESWDCKGKAAQLHTGKAHGVWKEGPLSMHFYYSNAFRKKGCNHSLMQGRI